MAIVQDIATVNASVTDLVTGGDEIQSAFSELARLAGAGQGGASPHSGYEDRSGSGWGVLIGGCLKRKA